MDPSHRGCHTYPDSREQRHWDSAQRLAAIPCMCPEWGCWNKSGKTTSMSVALERQTLLAFPPLNLTEWQERLELRKSPACQRVFPAMELKALSESPAPFLNHNSWLMILCKWGSCRMWDAYQLGATLRDWIWFCPLSARSQWLI